MSDIDIMESMRFSSSVKRYQTSEQPVQTNTTMRPIRRASLTTAAQPLVTRTSQQQDTRIRIPRPAQQPQPKGRTSQMYQQRPISEVDTDMDVEVAPCARRSDRLAPPTRQLPPMREHQGARFHWLVYVGIGMILILVLWTIAVPVWSGLVINVGSRWGHGPDDVTVLHGVFGHNSDSKAHPTRLEAYVERGQVEVAEIAAGDPAHSHIYTGPTLTTNVGWRGDQRGAVIDMQISTSTHNNGRHNVLLDVRGTSFDWGFQPQELKLTLVNMGDSFKLEAGGQ